MALITITNELIDQHRTVTKMLQDFVLEYGSENIDYARKAELRGAILDGLRSKQESLEAYIKLYHQELSR
jgi:hypothetical protein